MAVARPVAVGVAVRPVRVTRRAVRVRGVAMPEEETPARRFAPFRACCIRSRCRVYAGRMLVRERRCFWFRQLVS